MTATVGADPEFFLYNQHGTYVPPVPDMEEEAPPADMAEQAPPLNVGVNMGDAELLPIATAQRAQRLALDDPRFTTQQVQAQRGQAEQFGGPRTRHASRYIPCVGIIPGTKEHPHILADSGNEGFVCHEDNVCLEVGIPPATSATGFSRNIMFVKELVMTEFLNDKGLSLINYATLNFAPHQLQSKQAQNFGCEPDFDAYTNGTRRTIDPELVKGTRRFAGGHIHIGGEFNCPPFVAALFADIFLTLPFFTTKKNSFYTPEWQQRAQWYGKPGVFRPKPYGIEYRTPSCWWTRRADTAASMGNAALRLSRFLSETTATRLREAVRSINWLGLQQFLATPPPDAKERQMKASQMQEEIAVFMYGAI